MKALQVLEAILARIDGEWDNPCLEMMGELRTNELEDIREWCLDAINNPYIDKTKTLAKYQNCGCIICTCENEDQCQGCGAKHCGTHEVGNIPNPVYDVE